MAWACPSAVGACLLPCAAAGGFPGRLLQRVAFRDEKKAPEMRSGGRVCWSLDWTQVHCIRRGNAVGAGVVPGVGAALFDVRLRVSPVLCNRFCGSVWSGLPPSWASPIQVCRLGPATWRGFFCAVRCATECVWCLCGLPLLASRQSLWMNLAPPPGGAFSCGSPAQCANNFAAWR
jgi:hypothetical protein